MWVGGEVAEPFEPTFSSATALKLEWVDIFLMGFPRKLVVDLCELLWMWWIERDWIGIEICLLWVETEWWKENGEGIGEEGRADKSEKRWYTLWSLMTGRLGRSQDFIISKANFHYCL